MSEAAATLPNGNSKKEMTKAIVAGCMGNIVEWLDWSIYGLSAPFIAANFFPGDNQIVGLLVTYATFAVGFLMRPIGGIVIGVLGDKLGRNKVLAWTIVMMALGTGLIGCLPTYQQIGILAPILVLLLRLIQGFSVGGEFGTSMAFLYEIAPKNRRSLVSSVRPATTGVSFFIGSLLMSVLTSTLNPSALHAWGWRIPFIFAMILGFVGLYIRYQVPESPQFLEAKEKNEIVDNPLAQSVKKDGVQMLLLFGSTLVWSVVYYVIFTYFPVFLNTTTELPLATGMKITAAGTLVYSFMIIFFGYLGDKYDIKRMLEIACLGFIILAIPGFIMISSGNNLVIICLVEIVFALLMALYAGVATVYMSEMFPTQTRNTSINFAYNINNALFGGTAPLVSAYLATFNPIYPAYYLVGVSLINLICIFPVKFPGRK